MAKRANYSVSINGKDISSTLAPILTATTVSLRAGDEGDTATLTLDDTGGKIAMPAIGARIQISLGWSGQARRVIFDGTVDETISTCTRSGGRTLSVSAKGFDAGGNAKAKKRRHWDNATIQTIVSDAARAAGITSARVDPDLAAIVLKYWAMDDESLLHMGRRLAARIGGDFQVQGDVAQMARRGASYSPTVTATYGDNLHAWNLAPLLGRKIYAKVVAPFFNRTTGQWDKVEVDTGLGGSAVLTISPPADDRDDARRQARARATDSKRAAGGGQVQIEGTTDAVPDGACVVSGAPPGIDQSYRILGVTHALDRSGGWVTKLELGNPDQASETTTS
ncbi:phage late control D family protein [Paracoccus sp. KR1-242]|uniref:phage late control D family protein n=1 Tax=Paracoccus sp. KR1-242 TaxID=3410028 RepID=UPI003C0B47B6